MTKPPTFADLFEADSVPSARSRRLEVGDEAEGTVVHITKDEVFVELDEKQQGWFDREALLKSDGTLKVGVGDRVSGHVLMRDGSDGQVKLGLHIGAGASSEQLEAALASELPIEGKITGVNKGGAEVEIAGQRGFCPFSQLDTRYVEDPAEFVGRTVRFLVVEMKERGDVVLSRRRLLEREAAEQREEVLQQLEEGAVLRGRVSQVRDFGAFVDVGGLEGLIPMRELSHDRVQRPEDVVAIGDVVDVQVQKIERDGERTKITLSLRALAADPWDGIRTIAPAGKVVAGQVTRLMEYGAFVRIASGIEGLLHVSELGAAVEHPEAVLEVGQQLLLVVKDVDRSRKRLSLALAEDDAKPGDTATNLAPVLGAVVTATVEKHERFGVFAQVAGTKGRDGLGLIPSAELGITRGADVRKELPIGTEVRAKVIDATQGRLRLSIRVAREDAERAVYDSYRQEQSSRGGMGTLGDLLKSKLENK